MFFIGIDPGKSGGLAIVDDQGARVATLRLASATDRDVWDWVEGQTADVPSVRATIERVSSSPQMGVVSAFTFGSGAGFLRGILTASGIPFEEVAPARWQKAMGCLTGGDKNVSKAAAQRLWPRERITHAIADALLIAEYGRRQWAKMQAVG